MLNPWERLRDMLASPSPGNWLSAMLTRNSTSEYLRRYGSPSTLSEFREHVPLCRYEDLVPYIYRDTDNANVMFSGRPIAFEQTGGSTSGPKLIPYSVEGLLDFQRNIVPWLAETVTHFSISGTAYFSISPATRPAATVGAIPVGLPDGAYLGEGVGSILAQRTAVPVEVATLTDVGKWTERTVQHLLEAHDLELISVWSPTFLLRLLEHIPNPQASWPHLKVVSCWASGPSRTYAEELKQRLPHAEIQPKGLMSTEVVVTVPDAFSKPVLVPYGFFEFAQGDHTFLQEELIPSNVYEVVVTTASGLYRYRTGDLVSYEGTNHQGRPILEFIGRDALTSDLVGEKLTETFVRQCLAEIQGLAMLVPDTRQTGYALVCERPLSDAHLHSIEQRLSANPQYAYARKLGQLAPLRVVNNSAAASIFETAMLARGTRLGDIKPVALRRETFWQPLFEEPLQ